MFSIYQIALLFLISTKCVKGSIPSILELLVVENEMINNTKEWVNPSKKYDFIVVGAGSGGSAVANRLSENPKWNVLLLEAGSTPGAINQIPVASPIFELTNLNWGYKVEPQKHACLGMPNRQCPWPRGKALGGSSVLYNMIHTRGNRLDYDLWARMGNTGWAYKDILHYYRKSERFRVQGPYDPAYHNPYGYVCVENIPFRTPISPSFLEAGKQLGYNIVDYNGKDQIGFSYLQVNMDRGTRCSAAKAYLRVNRPNLDIVTKAHVTKVLITKNRRAIGVEYMQKGKLYKVYSSKEVILSAGTIDSAKLLMLSGIGPKEHLQKLKIGTIKDAKVGFNMREHLGFLGLVFLVDTPGTLNPGLFANPSTILQYTLNRSGPISSPVGPEAIAFIRTKYAIDSRPDMELLMIGGALHSDLGLFIRKTFGVSDETYNAAFRPIHNKNAWSVWPVIQNPRSVGRLTLRSKNPFDPPILDANFFSHPADVEIMLEGVRHAINISMTPALQAHGSRVYKMNIPGCEKYYFNSDNYWRCAIRHLPSVMNHEVGTVKMGPPSDPDAVVDPQLRVYGINGLRVIDASIMPTIPVGHINAGIYMIAEKGADMIKATWKNA